MKKELFRFLKGYTTDECAINKLIVSSYLCSQKISYVENTLINSLVIKKTEREYETLQAFNEKFVLDSLEKVIEAFEYVISPEDKIVSGAVYTPAAIREFIVDEVFTSSDNIENKTVCDPACGCSGFLFSSIEKFRVLTQKTFKDIIENNIFGLDVKEYAIERSKILLTLLAIDNGEDPEEISFNLFVGNALSNDWDKYIDDFCGFDMVVGNPPYVCSRNIDAESTALLVNWEVSSTGHPDLYIPFFEVGITILKEHGRMGFITMNSFYKSLNGRALRDYFATKRYKLKIVDFGGYQIFKANNTYTCICLLQKIQDDNISFCSSKYGDLDSLSYIQLSYSSLDSYSGWNLKLPSLINKIESVGKPFSSLFTTSSGIATLKNSVYVFDPVIEDDDYFYMDENTPIEKNICREVINTNKLTKVSDLESIKRKLIFPYYYKDKSAHVIPEAEFQRDFPNAYKYLLSNKDLLATRDKGDGRYAEWFAFGRHQSLVSYKYKLFFPHIASKSPHFIISKDEELLFINGLSLLSNNLDNIKLAQKIMSSRLFWFYIENTSKPYGAGFMSLSKNYIKNFGVYDFTEEEKEWLCKEKSQEVIDSFIEEKYGVSIDAI